jgi:WD40 repeat protein
MSSAGSHSNGSRGMRVVRLCLFFAALLQLFLALLLHPVCSSISLTLPFLTDVTDLAWSPEDRYLASVGLDAHVLVWCGFSLQCLHRITLHGGFVKGVCWDPVGEFLATASDDRSVKVCAKLCG